jgi:glucosamine--fructose-6-phosphate aminotransferase (isomerizing)
VNYTKNAVYLDDGEFAELTPEGITVFDCSGRRIEKPISRITWTVEAAEKGGYDHFMLKEIMEQPAAVRAAIAPRIRDGEIHLDEFDLSAEELERFNKIIITACGSAYYAGCAAKYALESICRIPVEVVLASELRYAHHELWGEVAMKKLLHRLIYYLRYRRHCSGFCVTCKFYEICKEEINFGSKNP